MRAEKLVDRLAPVARRASSLFAVPFEGARSARFSAPARATPCQSGISLWASCSNAAFIPGKCAVDGTFDQFCWREATGVQTEKPVLYFRYLHQNRIKTASKTGSQLPLFAINPEACFPFSSP
jgi:hypothetical protein